MSKISATSCIFNIHGLILKLCKYKDITYVQHLKKETSKASKLSMLYHSICTSFKILKATLVCIKYDYYTKLNTHECGKF